MPNPDNLSFFFFWVLLDFLIDEREVVDIIHTSQQQTPNQGNTMNVLNLQPGVASVHFLYNGKVRNFNVDEIHASTQTTITFVRNDEDTGFEDVYQTFRFDKISSVQTSHKHVVR